MSQLQFLSKIRVPILLCSLFFVKFGLLAQNKWGHLSGDFYATFQYYLEDEAIGAIGLPGGQDVGINTALSLNYTWKNFSAGIRYEAYEPPLLGFEPAMEGHGFGYRFVQYKYKSLDVTVGNFYEQFGSGLTLRSYYEPQLGLDNSIDGARLKFSPKGLDLTLVYGRNRKYFEKDDSKIAGLNIDIFLADYLESLETKNVSLDLGFSIVNKNETDETGLNLPAETTSYASRVDLRVQGFSLGVEYAFKGKGPHSLNGFTNNEGNGMFISSGYSTKGFGVNIYWKFVDNMFFRSDRESQSNVTSSINYLPPNSNVNTYRLMTLYPYATQGNGENGVNANIFYTIKKGSSLGGKYGTKVSLDLSYITDIKTISTGLKSYETKFLAFTDSLFYSNVNLEVTKRVNKQLRYIVGLGYINYNRDVNEGIPELGYAKSLTIFTDITYRLQNRKFIRTEFQHLGTKDHLGSWLLGLAEYGWSAKWSAYLSDEWNYDNDTHYYAAGLNYRKGATLVGLSYVRERSGLICVGGICRFVPASKGVKVQISTSF